jgi:hypothetical protein
MGRRIAEGRILPVSLKMGYDLKARASNMSHPPGACARRVPQVCVLGRPTRASDWGDFGQTARGRSSRRQMDAAASASVPSASPASLPAATAAAPAVLATACARGWAGKKCPRLPPRYLKTKFCFRGNSQIGGANSREPFKKSASMHGERRCRPISPCAVLRDAAMMIAASRFFEIRRSADHMHAVVWAPFYPRSANRLY